MADTGAALNAPALLPPAFDRLQTTVGLGYVQGADWGAQFLAGGASRGWQVALESLVTHGREGTRLDRGTLTLADPETGWRFDAGDVFSTLSGASRGARATWRASGDRRPSIAWYGSRPGLTHDRRSSPTATRFASLRRRCSTPKSLRINRRRPQPSGRSRISRSLRRGAICDIQCGRPIAACLRNCQSLADSRSAGAGSAPTWTASAASGARSIFVSRSSSWLRLTVERTFSESAGVTQALSAASANVAAGRLQAFHRHQWGETTINLAGRPEPIERQQIQSMAAYTQTAGCSSRCRWPPAGARTARRSTGKNSRRRCG